MLFYAPPIQGALYLTLEHPPPSSLLGAFFLLSAILPHTQSKNTPQISITVTKYPTILLKIPQHSTTPLCVSCLNHSVEYKRVYETTFWGIFYVTKMVVGNSAPHNTAIQYRKDTVPSARILRHRYENISRNDAVIGGPCGG